MTVEWQAYGNSPTVHVIDTERKAAKRSGPRALCGRYPGHSYRPWWVVEVGDPGLGRALGSWMLVRCGDCREKLELAPAK